MDLLTNHMDLLGLLLHVCFGTFMIITVTNSTNIYVPSSQFLSNKSFTVCSRLLNFIIDAVILSSLLCANIYSVTGLVYVLQVTTDF